VRRILFKIEDESSALGTQAEAVAVRQQLLIDPSQFVTKAKELSADNQTAAQGGLVDWFAQGEKDPVFERTAFLLKEDGDISDVIRTQDGFEILQRVGKKMRTYVPLAKVKSEIKDLLLQRKFKTVFADDMEQALKSPNQEEAIMRLVKERGGKQESVHPIDNDNSPLARALFGVKKDQMAFYVDGNNGFAIKVATVQDGYMPVLESIKKVVADDLYEERAIRALRQDVDKAKVEAKNKQMRDVAADFGASVQETNWIKRDDTKAVQSLDEKEIPTERILQLEKIGSLFAHSADKDGLVVRLDAVQEIEPAAFEAKRVELASAINQERIPLIMQGFVASLRRNATIKVNESVLNLYQ